MTTADRKWADFELEDDGELADLVNTSTGFETRPDEDGIKTVTNYMQTPKGETLKIVKRIKVIRRCHRINKAVYMRRDHMHPFGADADESGAKASTVKAHEEILLEIPKDSANRFKFREEEDDEDMTFADLNPAKTSRDLRQKFKALRDEDDGVEGNDAEEIGPGRGLSKCVTRGRRDVGDSMKEADNRRREECTIRVTNLSEDVKDDDLSELFGRVGKIDRVYLAKHKEKRCSKGFAFITYISKDDAEKAIKTLNRHGYDNLLLNVEWAKPSTRDRP